jgi:hypothetical protein
MKYARSALLGGLIAITVLTVPALAKGASGRSSPSHASSPRASGTAPHSSPRSARSSRCSSCTRQANVRIKRSSVAKHEFQRSNPCPSTGKTSGACPGYVIDHVTPLKRGGADAPSNMQWQTKENAKAKDKVE